jgi:hypothetical protein
MHNLDSMFMEGQGEALEFSAGEGEYGEGELAEYGEYGELNEGEYEEGKLGEAAYGEVFGEGETNELAEAMGEGELNELAEALGEGELNELAAELLSVSSEGELDHFLGGLFQKVASAAGSFIKRNIAQQLCGILKGIARKALPVAGAALGDLIAPGVGGVISGKLAPQASSMFGLELEGLSGEDREFELAKQFVRLATDAAQNVVGNANIANAAQVAQSAATQAAQKFAPGIVGSPAHGRHASGRWVRRGNKIILFGV